MMRFRRWARLSAIHFVVCADVEEIYLGLRQHEAQHYPVRVREAYGVLSEVLAGKGMEAKLGVVGIVLQLVQDEGEGFREVAVLLEELSGRALERVGPD